MMRLKRPGCRATIQGLQNGCLNFQVRFGIEILTHRVYQLRTFYKSVAYLRVYDQVHITHTVALFRICKSIMTGNIPLFIDRFLNNREGTQRF